MEQIAVDLGRLDSSLDEFLLEAREQIKALKFPGQRKERTVALLLPTVLKLAKSTVGAVHRRDGVEASIFLRSLLEAFVDLTLTIEDAVHIYRLEAVVLDQRRRVLQAACSGVPTQYLVSIACDPTAPLELTRVRELLDELKRTHGAPLKVRQRFARAGHLDLYEGPYSLLCDQSHNNLNALATRHFREVDGDGSVFLDTPTEDADLYKIGETASTVAARAVLHAATMLGVPASPTLDALGDRLAAVRACASASVPSEEQSTS